MGEDKGCFRYGKMTKNASFTARSIENFRVVAQPGSALVWGASGRWFESSPPDLVRNFPRTSLFFGQ
jgi:hypothetical protein